MPLFSKGLGALSCCRAAVRAAGTAAVSSHSPRSLSTATSPSQKHTFLLLRPPTCRPICLSASARTNFFFVSLSATAPFSTGSPAQAKAKSRAKSAKPKKHLSQSSNLNQALASAARPASMPNGHRTPAVVQPAAASSLPKTTLAPTHSTPSTATGGPEATAPLPTRSSLADQLARRSAPTLLYEAPSHFWFRAACLGAGFFCVAYTVGNYWTVFLHPPPDLAWWVPHAFGAICIVMTCLGGYFVLGGARIIRAIHAVPAARLSALAGPGVAARAAKAAGVPLSAVSTPSAVSPKTGDAPTAATAQPDAASTTATAAALPLPPPSDTVPIFLEVEIGRMLPILPARKLYVAPSAIVVPFRLSTLGLQGAAIGGPSTATAGTVAATSTATGYERVLARRAELERRKKAQQYEMDHLMTAPFRHARNGASVALQGIRRAFSREGFVPVSVDGKRYKLDISAGGWALENGRALDRLVTMR